MPMYFAVRQGFPELQKSSICVFTIGKVENTTLGTTYVIATHGLAAWSWPILNESRFPSGYTNEGVDFSSP